MCVFLSRTKSSMEAEKNLRKIGKKGQMYDEEERMAWMEVLGQSFFVCLFVCLLCLFAISWATPSAYGGSQARGPIGL